MTKNIDIPNGWEKTEFGNIVILRNKKYTPKSSENLKCIELECIEKENGNLLYYLNSNTQKSTKTYFYKNDILYGKLRPYLKKFIYAKDDGVCSSEIWVFSATKKINNYFLFLIVQTNKFNYITNISTGTRMPRADWDIVSNYPILLPPLAEQEKIAEILTLWDKAIEQTKELIAYKEKQKKGLMQNLLTGKKRLHGFNDKWKTVKLGEVIDKDIIYKKGQSLTAENANKGTIPVVAAGREIPYFHNNYNFKNIITISASGAYAGYIWYHNYPIWASDCNILYGQKDIFDTIFLFYILKLQQNKLYSLQTGGAQPHIYKNDICQLIIPKISFNEQKAIADILCKADEEIELLNKQLDLYMEQKKGLMQNLLTGKVRVTV